VTICCALPDIRRRPVGVTNDAGGASLTPPAVETHFTATSSMTRRFCDRPDSVMLLAIGF
jgi:hypothetical protein